MAWRERKSGILEDMAPQTRGPKANPDYGESKLRRDNARLTLDFRYFEISSTDELLTQQNRSTRGGYSPEAEAWRAAAVIQATISTDVTKAHGSVVSGSQIQAK